MEGGELLGKVLEVPPLVQEDEGALLALLVLLDVEFELFPFPVELEAGEEVEVLVNRVEAEICTELIHHTPEEES